MSETHSDALVFFGATGDLAYKKIFPSLQAMARRGNLDVPVIGVAKAGWNLDQLRARALESVEKYGRLDRDAFATLSARLRYIDGDYRDSATFDALRRELGDAKHPAHYLAIPPVLFGPVVEQLARSGCTQGARVVVEKPFGQDLTSARALNKTLVGTFAESDIFRIDHYLGKRPVHVPDRIIALGVTIMDSADQMLGQRAELVASRQAAPDEMAAYERVLTEALEGDATLFARMDYVEEAWRIVDPLQTLTTPVLPYEPGSWGPVDPAHDIVPPGGWANPMMDAQAAGYD